VAVSGIEAAALTMPLWAASYADSSDVTFMLLCVNVKLEGMLHRITAT
jgi:hypothetical protein